MGTVTKITNRKTLSEPVTSPEEQELSRHPYDATFDGASRKLYRAIKSSVTIHDRNQIETRFSYYLPPSDAGTGKNRQSYSVDVYMFFPRAMAVTSHSYPKEKFYQDLRPFLRLREPQLNFKELIGRSPNTYRSPILYLDEYIDRVIEGALVEPVQVALDESRIFASSYIAFFVRKRRKSRKHVDMAVHASGTESREKEIAEAVAFCRETLEKGFDAIKSLRKLREKAQLITRDEYRPLTRELELTDEYCSYALRDLLGSILILLQECSDYLPTEQYNKLQQKMKAVIRFEKWYSFKRGLLWVDEEASVAKQEAFVFRRSALKKHMQRVLYLDLRTKPAFTFQLQLANIVAAALAALWAFLADILIRTRSSTFGIGGQFAGISGFLLITAVILAYVLKDRIKEMGRSYFRGRLFSKIPDNSNVIQYHTPSGKKLKIGAIQEYTKFTFQERLPDNIRQARERHSSALVLEEEANDAIIHYRKSVQIDAHLLKDLHHPVEALNDIIRLNLDSFLPKLGEPLHHEYILSLHGGSKDVMMPKVYYLDLVFHYYKERVGATRDVLKYIRLVLSKDGLVRIEDLSETSPISD